MFVFLPAFFEKQEDKAFQMLAGVEPCDCTECNEALLALFSLTSACTLFAITDQNPSKTPASYLESLALSKVLTSNKYHPLFLLLSH